MPPTDSTAQPAAPANAELVHESELLVAVKASGLEPESQQRLVSSFQPLFDEAEKWRLQVAAIKVTDVADTRGMKMAREGRLALKAIRVNGDKVRKGLKEDVNRRGKAIDGAFNVLEFLIAPLEKTLLEQEQFAERKEAERIAAVKTEREELLKPFGIDTALYQLGLMPQEAFDALIEGQCLVVRQREEQAQAAHTARVAAENARLAEEARVRAENERLRKEAADRAEADRLAAERAAAEKAEADRIATETRQREAAARNARKVEREAALAPYGADATFIALGDMTQEDFDTLMAKTKEAHETALRQASEAREAQTRRDAALAEERRVADAQLAEQRRIAKEAADRAAADKAAADAKALADRQAREKAETNLAAVQKAEADRVAAAHAAQAAAAAAPDREKLLAFRTALLLIQMPDLTTEPARALAHRAVAQQAKFGVWMAAEIAKLSPAAPAAQ